MSHPCKIRGLAGADLDQDGYCFVYADGADSERIKTQATDTDTTTVGVLDPNRSSDGNKDGTLVSITSCGYAKVYAGGAIEPNDIVMTDDSGHAVPATAGKVQLGQFISKKRNSNGTFADAADGDIIDILLFENKTTLVAV